MSILLSERCFFPSKAPPYPAAAVTRLRASMLISGMIFWSVLPCPSGKLPTCGAKTPLQFRGLPYVPPRWGTPQSARVLDMLLSAVSWRLRWPSPLALVALLTLLPNRSTLGFEPVPEVSMDSPTRGALVFNPEQNPTTLFLLD